MPSIEAIPKDKFTGAGIGTFGTIRAAITFILLGGFTTTGSMLGFVVVIAEGIFIIGRTTGFSPQDGARAGRFDARPATD